MNFTVDLYRGAAFSPAGSLPLAEVLRAGLTPLLGRDLSHAVLRLVLLNVPEPPAPPTVPAIINLHPDYGYGGVLVYDDNRLTYRHPHPLSELVAAPLRARLGQTDAGETQWGFMISGPGLPALPKVLPAPLPKGGITITPFAQGNQSRLRLHRVVEENEPEASLADLSITPRPDQQARPVKVLIPAALHRDLLQTRPFSQEVEEGGFLIGKTFRDRDAPGTWLLEITHAIPGQQTGASLIHFTFTGDTFETMKQGLRRHGQGLRMLGWYHTHLFAATDSFGLSSIDVRLHFETFRQPWHLAGLVNLEDGGRTLRFYCRQQALMVPCPWWVIRP